MKTRTPSIIRSRTSVVRPTLQRKKFSFPHTPMKLSLKFLVALVAISLCRQIPAATFNIADGDVAALIDAINMSNANGADDTIELATNGTYTLTTIDNGDNGLPVILSDGAPGHTLVIHGNGATLQRDTAGGTPQFRIFQIGPDADVTIDGLVIMNGNVGSFNLGGGIYNDHAMLTIANSTVSGNSAGNVGGGILNDGELDGSATLTVTNSTLSGNSAGNGGGGIYNISDTSGSATLTVTDSTISGNSAGNGILAGSGGGIFNVGGGGSASATLTVTDSTISGNSADRGGGIYNFAGVNGGATLTVTNSTLSGNSADLSGGGIVNVSDTSGSATLTVSNSTLSSNSASAGGGIVNAGGGDSASATLTVTNSTLSGNSASAGGGIYNVTDTDGSAEVAIGDTILNAGASGENIYNYAGTVASHGYNISSEGGVTNDGGGTGDLMATGDQINTNPMLGPLQDNGGPTFTHALLTGSPAIDTGDPAFDPNNFNPPLLYDQRGNGFPRVVNGRIDIGAFEVQLSFGAHIQQPINPDESSVFNVHRGVVPVKFTLTLDGVATCDLQPATISLTRTAGGTTGEIDESVYSGPADTGSNFRIDSCQYVYNLSSSALGPGTYRVDITINTQVVGSATFQLR
jgi:hypothetical protein